MLPKYIFAIINVSAKNVHIGFHSG